MPLTTENVKLAFERIEASGMAPWVGGGDTCEVGLQNVEAINGLIPIRRNWRVLDFGCGVGRLSAPLADFLTEGQIVGIDMVPKMVEFCRREIEPIFANASFVLSKSSNPHYDQYLSDTALPALEIDAWAQDNLERFDLICALSVFTHLDAPMATSTLQLFSRVLRPGGFVFLTIFLDLEENPDDRKLHQGETYRDCWPDRLAWVVYDQTSLLRLAHQAGLSPRKVIFGHWRVDGMSSVEGAHFQDAMVLGRPVRLPKDFDSETYLSLHPDLLAANVDGTQHYLHHGYFEGRAHADLARAEENEAKSIQFHIDVANVRLVEGWAFSDRCAVNVAIEVDGREIASFIPWLPRKDVANDHGNVRNSELCGFRYVLREELGDSANTRATSVKITLSELDITEPHVEIIIVKLSQPREYFDANVVFEPCDGIKGPFPSYILRWLWYNEEDTEYLCGPWSEASIRRAVDKLLELYRTSNLPDLPRYFGMLARSWMTIKFIERRFPFANSSRMPDAKDFKAAQTSAVEMFAISHHVAVLSSYDLNGPLLEFGCFKGFSTAALSHICREFGLRMEVFDSFSGLPPSNSSTYQEGDFAGSLEEVRQNIESFGHLEVVSFHEGYFSDTIPTFNAPEVSCIWVDVDLELSASDAMQTLPMLSPLGCVFSHECDPEWFVGGKVQNPPRGPESVIPSILDAFDRAGRRPAGRFVHGQTGAFWDADHGIPVLPMDQLLRLKEAAIQGL